MANIIPYLLTDFQETSIVPHNAMQKFVLDKQQSNVGYGIFGPKKAATLVIVKYNFVAGGTSTPVSAFTVKPSNGINPGHCESMEIYHDGGQSYLLITTKASAGNYGTQLTRIPASRIDNGGSAPYTDFPRIGSMNHVGYSKSWGTPDRLEMAVNSAESKIVLWSFAHDTTSHMALYSMSDIKALFAKAEQSSTNEVTIAGTPYTKPSILSGATKKQMFVVVDPDGQGNGSCLLQGMALTNGDSVYVGAESGIGNPLTIHGAKSLWKFGVGASNSGTPKKVTNGHWTTFTKEQGHDGKAGVEMEGLQIVGGDLYMTVAYHSWNSSTGSAETQKNRLYHFDKTLV